MWKFLEQPSIDKEGTIVRAVTMPIACPVACLVRKGSKYVPAELPQPIEEKKGKRKGIEFSPLDLLWHHFREQLREMWWLTSRAMNWAIQEMLRREKPIGIGEKVEKIKKPNGSESASLFTAFNRSHPDRPRWNGMAGSLASALRTAEQKYLDSRKRSIGFQVANVPGFKCPQPFPVRAQEWSPAHREEKSQDDGDFFVSFPIGGFRWILRLRRDPTSMKFNPIWKSIQAGELVWCEAQIYGQRVEGNDNRNGMTIRLPGGGETVDYRLMFKSVYRTIRKPLERSQSTALVCTDPNAMFVVQVDDRPPWILNADHVKRWVAKHRVFLQRFSEDTKYEKRWPEDVRLHMNESREKRCKKQNDRVTTFVEQSARSIAEYARRNRCCRVVFNSSSKGYVESFPYDQFRLKLEQNLDEYGIEFLKSEERK